MKEKRQPEQQTAEIIILPTARAPATPLAHFIRVGESGHLQLEELHAHGRFPAKAVVIDASRFKFQQKFFEALKREGVELVLDTKVAELAEPAKRLGLARHTPWASQVDLAPMGPKYFETGTHDILRQIADFAIQYGFSAVLAPCHFLRSGSNDEWFRVDLRSCERLRKLLDTNGGKNIAIDYSLIVSHSALRDEAIRGALLTKLSGAPFENLWIRASGFGASSTPAGTRAYINALSALHNLGKPIIADYLGGLVGLGALAFGAASGLAHGVGERERFDASGWHQPPVKDEEKKSGGRTNRIYVPALDHSLTVQELKALAKARGGRRLIACSDRECCPDMDDMIKDWRSHFLRQRSNQIQRIANIPDLKREADFIAKDLATADQQSRQIKELNPIESELKPRRGETASQAKEKLIERLKKYSRREEKMRATLEDLHETRGEGAPRARSARFRGTTANKKTDLQEEKK